MEAFVAWEPPNTGAPPNSTPAQTKASHLGEQPIPPRLTENEAQVLQVPRGRHRLTFSQLMDITGQDDSELQVALDGLHSAGLTAQIADGD